VAGGAIHLKHFFGFPSYSFIAKGTYYAFTRIYAPTERIQDFWVGFQGWSRSGGRRGCHPPKLGEWHNTQPAIWVNDEIIEPHHGNRQTIQKKAMKSPLWTRTTFTETQRR